MERPAAGKISVRFPEILMFISGSVADLDVSIIIVRLWREFGRCSASRSLQDDGSVASKGTSLRAFTCFNVQAAVFINSVYYCWTAVRKVNNTGNAIDDQLIRKKDYKQSVNR